MCVQGMDGNDGEQGHPGETGNDGEHVGSLIFNCCYMRVWINCMTLLHAYTGSTREEWQ